MQKNSQNFSMQEALRLANSDAGQRLLALLKQSNSADLTKASRLAAAGDYAGALESLSPLMESREVRALLNQLEE